jgi:hypothetical protein
MRVELKEMTAELECEEGPSSARALTQTTGAPHSLHHDGVIP